MPAAKQTKSVAVIESSQFAGPIPHPEIMQGYESVLPGAAERILAMAEKQSRHRQDMETKVLKIQSRDSLLGIIFAFVIGMSCLLAGVIIIINVPENAGAISGSIVSVMGIGSIVATFITSTRINKGTKTENE